MKIRHALALAALALVGCVDDHSIGMAPTPLAPARWAIRIDNASPGTDAATKVAFAPDEDVVAFGVSGDDSWITKRAHEDGRERWTKTIHMTSADGQVHIGSPDAIAVGPDSSIVFVGSYSGRVEIAGMQLGPGHGALIGKLSSTGTLEWLHIVGPQQGAAFAAVSIDHDGQIFVSGAFDGVLDTSQGQYVSANGSGLLMAFDPDGDLRWTRQLPMQLNFQVGRTDDLVAVATIDHRTTINGQTVDSLAAYTPIQVRMTRAGSFDAFSVVGLDAIAESPMGYAIEADGRIAMASAIDGQSLAERSTSVSLSTPDGNRVWTQHDDDAHALVDATTLVANGDIVVAGHFADPLRLLGSGSTLGAISLRIHDAASGTVISTQTFGELEWTGVSAISRIAANASGDIAFAGTIDEPIDFGSGTLGTTAPSEGADNRAAVIGVFGD